MSTAENSNKNKTDEYTQKGKKNTGSLMES